MSEPKFTPGPWEVSSYDGDAQSVYAEDGCVCILFDHHYEYPLPDDNQEVCNANARLIAAAPEMYEALSWALDLLDLYDRRLVGIDGEDKVYDSNHVRAKAKARAALEKACEDAVSE